MNTEIRGISDEDYSLIKDFDCNEKNMNDFFWSYAIGYNNTGDGKTKVIIDKDNNKIIGFFTLKCNALQTEGDEAEVIPAIEVSRFGIEKCYQKRGIGKIVFAYVINYINSIKKDYLGVKMIVLYALPNVIKFYSNNFKFKELVYSKYDDFECKSNQGCTPMYLFIH